LLTASPVPPWPCRPRALNSTSRREAPSGGVAFVDQRRNAFGYRTVFCFFGPPGVAAQALASRFRKTCFLVSSFFFRAFFRDRGLALPYPSSFRPASGSSLGLLSQRFFGGSGCSRSAFSAGFASASGPALVGHDRFFCSLILPRRPHRPLGFGTFSNQTASGCPSLRF